MVLQFLDQSLPDIISEVAALDKKHADDDTRFVVDLHANCTVDQFIPIIKAELYQRHVTPRFRQGDYDTYLQELLASQTGLGSEPPDIGIVILHAENFCILDDQGIIDLELSEERLINFLGAIADRSYPMLISNLAWPKNSSSYDNKDNSRSVEKLNVLILETVGASSSLWLLDHHLVASALGTHAAFDRRAWFRFKAPFSIDFIKSIASDIGQIVADLKGLSRKCLLLDCDNTLWGGVVGEDGLEGIELDPHSYPGIVFYKFQQQIKALERRGVMIALISKNNEEDVLEVLENHPHCLLSKEDLVGYRINWEDKPSNVGDLVESLNIGMDSVVFIDDSDIECDLMRQALPLVETIQVPKKIWGLPAMLPEARLFSPRRPTTEDGSRTKMYREAAERHNSGKKFASMDDYLSSLEITAKIERADKNNIPRISQLFARTNQFMLTADRPTEAELTRLANSDQAFVYALSSSDKFGELGIIGALLLEERSEGLAVRSFALSCRGLGRKLENAFFEAAVSNAIAQVSTKYICSKYQPSKKNAQVSDLYDRFGLIISNTSEGEVNYRVKAEDLAVDVPSFIKVVLHV
jgi:FkbH-like protein